ncbi:MAG TPA: type II toxin-antitoxin system VapC family toxin [Gallionella sp.]|nr:type II toxin-antitoxin system VapC family toxin [Gallionella sp.]
MISVDTNVLIRILVNDPDNATQVEHARQAVNRYQTVYVSQIVQVETVWVLKSAYGFAKVDILRVLEHLRENQAFKLEHEQLFELALAVYGESTIDFSDALILTNSRQHHLPLLTFDKKLLALPGTQRVEPA